MSCVSEENAYKVGTPNITSRNNNIDSLSVTPRSILRFKANNTQGAADDLNMVRSRAWSDSVAGAYVPIDAVTLTEKMIHNERIIEMFNEPDRVEYLRALKMNIPAGDRENTASEPYNSENFVWAIPIEESDFNENIE